MLGMVVIGWLLSCLVDLGDWEFLLVCLVEYWDLSKQLCLVLMLES